MKWSPLKRLDSPIYLRCLLMIAASCGASALAAPEAATSCARWSGGDGPHSVWVYPDPQGKLIYRTLSERGDRIIDFSYAGYMGGGVAWPQVAVAETVEAGSGTDDTALIQAAIDKVARLPLVQGMRGAVLLKPGNYQIAGTLHIAASGIVLRGGEGGTVLRATGASHTVLQIGGAGKSVADKASETLVTDAYVPAGTAVLHVADATKFKVGDEVEVTRHITAKWVQAMGMDTLVRNGQPQTWLKPGREQVWQRRIAAIAGSSLTLDMPLSDALDSAYTGAAGSRVARYGNPGQIVQNGVEHLRFEGAPRTGVLGSGIEYRAILIGNAADAWVDDVIGHNMIEGVNVEHDGKRVTIKSVQLLHDHDLNLSTGAKAFEFSIAGSQVLIDRSASSGSKGAFYAATQSLSVGPNVLLNFRGQASDNASLQPHQRWATGLLVDGASVSGGIDFINRLTAGSGHGWSMGWGVAWNSVADSLDLQQPPGSTNWAIGNVSRTRPPVSKHALAPPSGPVDSPQRPVTPHSLYLAQLCQRLGPAALANIGYR